MKHKSALKVLPLFGSHRTVLIAALSFSLAFVSGCVSSRKSTNRGNLFPWSAKTADSDSRHEKSEKPIEPLVAANVPLGNVPATETSSSNTVDKASDFDSIIKDVEAFTESRRTVESSKITKVEPGGSDSTAAIVEQKADNAESSINRLNAALWDDTPSDVLPQKSLTALDNRMKIETLVSQAKRLLEIGQIEQARQIATTAQDLGETSQVDFSPDEDRPIDLIRRIDGQLEASRLRNETRSETASVDPQTVSPVEQIEAAKTTADENPSSKTRKDPSNISRLRRDWSTLFRREKKVVVQESVPTFSDPQPISPTFLDSTNSDQEKTDRSRRATTKNEIREPVVVANRSVSLGSTDENISETESFVQVNDELEWIDEKSASGQPETVLQTSKVGELPDLLEIPLNEPAPSIASNAVRDEIPEVTADFEATKAQPGPQVPLETPVERTQTVEEFAAREHDATPPNSTWLYIAFGLCGLLAFGYYRRGAT